MCKVHELLGFALAMESMMGVNQEQWKDDVREKWELTKKMPRKKKKRERKSLLIEWSMANWSPYDDGYFKC